jgi:hypothetical protein
MSHVGYASALPLCLGRKGVLLDALSSHGPSIFRAAQSPIIPIFLLECNLSPILASSHAGGNRQAIGLRTTMNRCRLAIITPGDLPMTRTLHTTQLAARRPCATQLTRRKLLTMVGAGAIAAPLVLPARLFGADAPSKRLNVAAVGMGGRARALMSEIFRQGENLMAFCDVDQRQWPSVRQAFAGRVEGADPALEKARFYDD